MKKVVYVFVEPAIGLAQQTVKLGKQFDLSPKTVESRIQAFFEQGFLMANIPYCRLGRSEMMPLGFFLKLIDLETDGDWYSLECAVLKKLEINQPYRMIVPAVPKLHQAFLVLVGLVVYPVVGSPEEELSMGNQHVATMVKHLGPFFQWRQERRQENKTDYLGYCLPCDKEFILKYAGVSSN